MAVYFIKLLVMFKLTLCYQNYMLMQRPEFK